MTKQKAREQMRRLRKELSHEEREEKNQLIFQHVMQMEAMKNQSYFFPFVSYGTEVDTIRIIEKVLQEKRMKVAIPRVKEKEMDFYQITSMEELSKGYQGILEPVTQKCVLAAEGVMLLPGLAFDKKKNRVGYGGGYYDRYLKRCQKENIITIALAFDFQIVDKIEAEDFDVRPRWIVTEKGIY